MSAEEIRSAIESAVAYLTENPDQARYTDTAATAVLTHDLRVRVHGPAGELLETDMPPAVGGTGAAPSPGGSCGQPWRAASRPWCRCAPLWKAWRSPG